MVASLVNKRISEKHVVHVPDNGDHKTSLPLASFILANGIVGSIIVLPGTLEQAGFGLGILLVIVFAFLSDYTLKLLIHAGNLAEVSTYPQVIVKAFGKCGFVLVTILMIGYLFLILVAVNVVIGDMGVKLVLLVAGTEAESEFFASRWFVIGVVDFAILLPLSLFRSIKRLSQASVVAIILDVIFIAFMSIRLATLDLPPTDNAYVFAKWTVVDAAGIILTLFVIHITAFLVYDSLQNPTEKRWGEVTNISIIIATVIFLLAGIIGFVTFTGNTKGDVLENYCSDDRLMATARFFFLITMMLTFPILAFVLRTTLVEAVFVRVQKPTPLYFHFLITLFIIGGAYGISLTTSCLSLVIEITGFVAATPLAYVLPPLAVLKLQKEPIRSKSSIPLILTALLGISLTFVGISISVFAIIDGKTCPATDGDPAFCTQ